MIDNNIVNDIKIDKDYVISLRRYFHKHPELPKQEYNTAAKIEEELDKLNIPHKRVANTGVWGIIKGKYEGKRIILRADIDALPILEEHETEYKSENTGVMHACGHDAHTASLLGAARILAKNIDKLHGVVELHFQLAEEIGFGAYQFINEGYLDDASRSFGIHTAPDINVGSFVVVPGATNASVDWFRITVHGFEAHVSLPQEGVDALYVASQIVVAAQGLTTRLTSPIDPLLIGIGKLEAGTAYNVIAKTATLEGTIRAFNPKTREMIMAKLEECSKNIAGIYGATIEIEWADYTSPLINDKDVAADVIRVFKDYYGDKLHTERTLALSGDDFAEYILKVPGCYVYVGSRNPNIYETTLAAHTSCFDIDEDCLEVATTLYTCYALDYLK